MASLDFEEIVRLINHSRTTSIDLAPVKSGKEGWALHSGKYRVHSSEFPFTLLSLNSRATKQSNEEAFRDAFVTGETQVVYSPSLSSRTLSHKELFEKKAKGFWTLKEYLASFLKDELQAYLEQMKELRANDFIDPRIRVPAGVPRRYPSPLLSFLRESEGAAAVGALGVLLAEPGQGKTYLARQTAALLASMENAPVPIFIDSTQWVGLPLQDLSSIARTIAHSFRHFNCPIAWLDGHEDEFLRVTLKADLFRIVFDGFDEFVLANRGAASAVEVLDAIAELATSTESRILLTSRTTFWNASIPEAASDPGGNACTVHGFEFEPFDSSGAQQYFKKRLDVAGAKRALQVFDQVRERSTDLAGRGFVLNLIADVAHEGSEGSLSTSARSNVLLWLFDALCQREQLRQQLPIDSGDQIRAFKMIALETGCGESPDSALVDYAIGIVRPDLGIAARSICVEKLRTHPLLNWTRQDDRWSFRQEQAEVFFLASQICAFAPNDLRNRLEKLELISGRRQDVAASVVDLLGVDGPDAQKGAVRGIVISLTRPVRISREGASRMPEGAYLAGVLAQIAPDRILPRGTSHVDRTRLFVEVVGGAAADGLAFGSTIARFDFRGVEFVDCQFEYVTWAACAFDTSTIFRRCRFIGALPPQKCSGLADAQFVDCELDLEATAWLESIRIQEGRKAYDDRALRSDLEEALGRFLGRGGVGAKTVTSRTLVRGIFGSSRHKEEILDVLKSTVLGTHTISGTSEVGYHVREEARAALQFFAANNVFTGPLKAAFETLVKRLKLQ